MPERRLGKLFRPKSGGKWDQAKTWTAPTWEEDHATDIAIARQLAEEDGRPDPFAPQYPLEPVTKYEDNRPSLKKLRQSIGQKLTLRDRHPISISTAKVVLTSAVFYMANEYQAPFLDPLALNWYQLFAGTVAAASSIVQTIFPENSQDGAIRGKIKKAFRQPLVSFYAAAYSIPAFFELSNRLTEAVGFFLNGQDIVSVKGIIEGLSGAGSVLGLSAIALAYGFTYIPSYTQIKESIEQSHHRQSLNIWSGRPSTNEALWSYIHHPPHPEDITKELEFLRPTNAKSLEWMREAAHSAAEMVHDDHIRNQAKLVYRGVINFIPRNDQKGKLSEHQIAEIEQAALNKMLNVILEDVPFWERADAARDAINVGRGAFRQNFDGSDAQRWLVVIANHFIREHNEMVALSEARQRKTVNAKNRQRTGNEFNNG